MPRTKKAKLHPEQSELPGAETGNEKIQSIHNAAKRYQRERDARIAANEREKAAHEYLLDAMTREGLTHYKNGGIEVFVDSSYKCKVSAVAKGDDAAPTPDAGNGEAGES